MPRSCPLFYFFLELTFIWFFNLLLATEKNTDAESSVIVLDSDEGNRTKRRQKCRLCGQFRKGHICPFIKSSTNSTSPRSQTASLRTASNRENLSRLAQKVDGDTINGRKIHL